MWHIFEYLIGFIYVLVRKCAELHFLLQFYIVVACEKFVHLLPLNLGPA